METKTIEERKKILETQISKYVKQGWRVSSQSDTTAQLVRQKSPSCLVAFILALFLILPAILYFLLYKGSESLYIEVDEQGKIHTTSG